MYCQVWLYCHVMCHNVFKIQALQLQRECPEFIFSRGQKTVAQTTDLAS
jgi:hypothetical protein